jgi:hypothetical protein
MQSTYSSEDKKVESLVDSRWFALIDWIHSSDLMYTLRVELVKIIQYIGKYIFLLLAITSWVTAIFIENNVFVTYFLYGFVILWMFLCLYLCIRWIQGSVVLLRNRHILFLDTTTIINGKILSNNQVDLIASEFAGVEHFFNRNIHPEDQRSSVSELFIYEIKDWFNKIYSKKIGSFMAFILFYYLLYVIIIWILFSAGVVMSACIGLILWIMSEWIYRIAWHEQTTIHALFVEIEGSSNQIEKDIASLTTRVNELRMHVYTEETMHYLEKESLKICNNINNSIDKNSQLKRILQKGEFKDIYNINKYTMWLKNELMKPNIELRLLLMHSIETIDGQITELTKNQQIQNTHLKSTLNLQQIRLNLCKKNIYTRLEQVNNFINKLS